jgi:hypothetical protein
VETQQLERLSQLAHGDRASVRRVSDRDAAALHRLGAAKLFPGADLQVVERTEATGLRLRVGAEEIVLAAPDAARVFVERVEE